MGKRTQRGICSICGEYGDLTWEHIPPKSAYNDRRLEVLDGAKALDARLDERPRGRVQQRGAGGHYTCSSCNNRTGDWYVREFTKWVIRGASVLAEIGDADGQDSRSYARVVGVTFVGVRPLLFLKQVVYMFMAINGHGFGNRYPDLRRFVLCRDSTGLPDVHHFHLALTWGPGTRQVGNTGASGFGGPTVMSDISFPPFSYVMWTGQPHHSLAPCEISRFASFGVDEVADITMPLQVGFTHVVFPSDYRSRASIERCVEESLRQVPGS